MLHRIISRWTVLDAPFISLCPYQAICLPQLLPIFITYLFRHSCNALYATPLPIFGREPSLLVVLPVCIAAFTQNPFPPEIEHSYRCNSVVKRFKKLSGLQPSTLTSSCAGSPFGLQATKIGRRSRPCACLLERFGLHATRTPQHCKSFVESLRFGQTIWRSSQTRFTPPVRARARACVCATACDGIPPALFYC